jgi:UPF0755 protein
VAEREPSGCWRVLVGGLTLVCLALTALAGHFWWWTTRAELLSAGADPVVIVVEEGAGWRLVTRQLDDAGLVEHPLYLEVWARRHGLPEQVKSGTYTLRGPLTLPQLARALSLGGPAGIALTVPEGWTIYHIAERVEALGICSGEDFLREATDPALLDELGLKARYSAPSMEGYLFPETYHFNAKTPASAVIKRMHAEFERRWARLEAAHPEALAAMMRVHKLNRHQLITLASLVERESSLDAERPTIARVFLNRLAQKMRLQTDPSCTYGPMTFRKAPTPVLCKDKASRYSTYVIPGLPPGPIANPGAAALEAALNPDPSPAAREYLFFVAARDGSGGHVFTKSFDDHKAAVKRHLGGPSK